MQLYGRFWIDAKKWDTFFGNNGTISHTRCNIRPMHLDTYKQEAGSCSLIDGIYELEKTKKKENRKKRRKTSW